MLCHKYFKLELIGFIALCCTISKVKTENKAKMTESVSVMSNKL